MKCRDKYCRKGDIDIRLEDPRIELQIGWNGDQKVTRPAFSCKRCGRLHWISGSPVQTISGFRVYDSDDGVFYVDHARKKHFEPVIYRC